MTRSPMPSDTPSTAQPPLLQDIRSLIDAARHRVAARVNAEITVLYWQVGRRVHVEVLQGERAGYGQRLIPQLSQALTQKREFYIELCRHERWSVRQLQERIQSMLFERTAISQKPEQTIQNDLQALRSDGKLSADLAFRDPYVLDFLGLRDNYSEQDLESAIISDLQNFIIELGSDFAFLARQKRLTIDGRDYKIDLLFYHRRLKSLVAIDLKLGEFEAAYKGQMELYLRWLEKHEQVEGENAPIGLILCAGKNTEHVELLQLDKSNIRVAQYLTLLPSQEVFSCKLHQAIVLARARLQTP